MTTNTKSTSTTTSAASTSHLISTSATLSKMKSEKTETSKLATHIDLSSQKLQRLSGSKFFLYKNLVSLNVSGNELQEFPVLYHDRLRVVDLSSNQLKSLPNVSHLSSLEELNVEHNVIDNLNNAAVLLLPAKLKSLKVADNKIADLTQFKHVKHCKQLHTLTVSDNPCTCLQFDHRPYVISQFFDATGALTLKLLDGHEIDESERMKAEWLYSQGRSNRFTIGQHTELVAYLTQYCPLDQRNASRQSMKLEDSIARVVSTMKENRTTSGSGSSIASSTMSVSESFSKSPRFAMTTVRHSPIAGVQQHSIESGDKENQQQQQSSTTSGSNRHVTERTTDRLQNRLSDQLNRTYDCLLGDEGDEPVTDSNVTAPGPVTRSAIPMRTREAAIATHTKSRGPASKAPPKLAIKLPNLGDQQHFGAIDSDSTDYHTPRQCVNVKSKLVVSRDQQQIDASANRRIQSVTKLQAWWRGVRYRRSTECQLMLQRLIMKRQEEWILKLNEDVELTKKVNETQTELLDSIIRRVAQLETEQQRLTNVTRCLLPSVANLQVQRRSEDSAVLSWTLARQMDLVKGFKIFVDGEECGTVRNFPMSTVISELNAESSYSVSVCPTLSIGDSTMLGHSSETAQIRPVVPRPDADRQLELHDVAVSVPDKEFSDSGAGDGPTTTDSSPLTTTAPPIPHQSPTTTSTTTVPKDPFDIPASTSTQSQPTEPDCQGQETGDVSQQDKISNDSNRSASTETAPEEN